MADAYLQMMNSATWATWASAAALGGTAPIFGCGATTQTATTDTTWLYWAQAGAMRQQFGGSVQPNVPTPEQLAAQAAAQAARDAKRAAERKARALLLSYLDEDQRVSYEAEEAFFVTTPSGVRFRLKKHGRATEYQKDAFGRYVAKFQHCLVSEGNVPDEDRLLHLKVLLAVDERKFRHISVATAV